MSESEPVAPEEELAHLVRQFRLRLSRLRGGGVTHVQSSASPGRVPLPSKPMPDSGARAVATLPTAPGQVERDVTSDELGAVIASLGDSPSGGHIDLRHDDTAPRKTLPQIREELGDCQRCELSTTRKSIVFGTGAQSASLMFVGEAPGADEDASGEPFVGRAGQLLDKMIVAMGWQREEVYITNVLKCRPPKNRDPNTEEIAACKGFVAQQIRSVNPTVIVTLGKPAAHLLLNSRETMGKLRGTWQSYGDIPVMPTFHPAYLLRDPSKKRYTWADLQQVMKRLDEQGLGPRK